DARTCRLAVLLVLLGLVAGAQGALTSAQKKELAAIRTLLMRVRTPVKYDAIEQAESKTAEADERLQALAKEAGLPDDDPLLAPVRKLVAPRREAIARAREKEQKTPAKKAKPAGESAARKTSTAKKGGDAKLSFVANVAPIFQKHCLGCHGAEGKGGLRLD